MQLKLGHGHFKLYLKRLPHFDSDKCDCNRYLIERKRMKEKLQIGSLSLKILLTAKSGIQTVLEFLEKTKIVRRNWLSN
jgi:hypothetical protein